MPITRRELLLTLPVAPIALSAYAQLTSSSATAARFAHGVASGDPLHDRVILWTRVSPEPGVYSVEGRWKISSDPQLRRVVNSGSFVTDSSRDFTVKIDADELQPNRTYYYQFETTGARSPFGRTRTLPLGATDHWRLAFVSCSNFESGYFNVYARIAQRNDLDCVLHLGDYLYEYAIDGYAAPGLRGRRNVQPTNETLTLADYRQRHALYKTDLDLQEAHRQHPFICVWDDHESANDSWRDGAENHNPELGEGDWQVRKRSAMRAYHEYMPIRSRPGHDDTIYRRFRIGDLADLLMLDTRLHGRDHQAPFKEGADAVAANDAVLADPKRTLLGFDQELWLANELRESKDRGATWRLLGQQIMMAQLSTTAGRSYMNPDQWDGYAPARERLLRQLLGNDIRNNIVLSGDSHSTWCSDVAIDPWDNAAYNADTGAGVAAVEFVAPAITSPGPASDAANSSAQSAQLCAVSPHFKYVDLYQRGYGVLDITPERAQGEIYHIATVDTPTLADKLAAAFATENGSNRLQPVSGTLSQGFDAEPAPAEDMSSEPLTHSGSERSRRG
jgi:alkaline phosphatase D